MIAAIRKFFCIFTDPHVCESQCVYCRWAESGDKRSLFDWHYGKEIKEKKD